MTKKKNDENSFVFYRSFYDVIHLIPDEAMRGRAYEAICEYAFYGEESDENDNILVRMVFTQAKPQLDANAKRRADGSTGGRTRKAELQEKTDGDKQTEEISPNVKSGTVEPDEIQSVPSSVTTREPETGGFSNENHWFPDEKPNVNVNVNENVNENENANENEGKAKPARFTPPTHAQVTDYIAENGLIVDADRFMDYYIANGWKVGKNAMKSWKAALRNWARHEERYTAQPHSMTTAHGTANRKGGSNYGAITPQFGICL